MMESLKENHRGRDINCCHRDRKIALILAAIRNEHKLYDSYVEKILTIAPSNSVTRRQQ